MSKRKAAIIQTVDAKNIKSSKSVLDTASGIESEHGDAVASSKKAEMKSKMERLTRETIILRQEILELKDTVANVVRQNQTILNLIGEQQVMISGIFKVESKPNCLYTARFPLQTQEDLDAIEAEIDDTNRDKLVASVQALVTPGGLVKNLGTLLSLEICLDYNIEGVHNKKRLQNYPKLLDAMFRATMKNGWTQKQFLEDLRKGLKQMKNRHFKAMCLLRKREREGQISTTDINANNDADFDEDDEDNEDNEDSKNYII